MTPTPGSIHPSEPSHRIEPRPLSELRPDWLATLNRIPGEGLKGEGFPKNVLGVLMHNPDTFGPFLEYWVTCKSKMGLSVREQELVILRLGVLYRSDYVFRHHFLVGREFGISEAEFDAVRSGDYSLFPKRESALLVLTDELVEQRTIRAETWARERGALSDGEVVDLVHLVAQYVLFALANNVGQVQLEPALDEVPGIFNRGE